MPFFKVVRPDLSSFHDPNFGYAIGKTRRAPGPRPAVIRVQMAGVLHASTSAPEAARWGVWPYRLLEVAGKPLTEPDSDGKVAFRQLTVVAERDVAECFGPNGQAVVRLLDQVGRLTVGQAEQLYAARSAAGDATWYATWDAAGAASHAAARDAVRDAASDATWYATGYAAGDATWYAAGAASHAAARDAVRDAAAALVVVDLVGRHGLEQHHIDTLLAPWIETVGDPR